MWQSKGSKTEWAKYFTILALIVAISGCASWQKVYHGVLMKGSIIETYDSEIYLCIGKKDGASVGQELNVYKVIATTMNPKVPMFRREHTGKVRITEIIDDHFAKAIIISGKAEKNDIVELP
jgi:hypothetical protein